MAEINEENESSSNQYPDHWLEGIVWKILERNPEEVNLSTGKTPSGHVHVGILRELLICETLRRILVSKNIPVNYRLFFDSLDAAKHFPDYISKEYGEQYAGRPFALIPNPFEDDGRSFAQFFGEELSSNFDELGINVQIYWTHELYKTEAMQNMIRLALTKNDEVKEIIAKFLTATMNDDEKEDFFQQQESWMGAMVICEQCQSTQKHLPDGSIAANRVLSYDPESDEVTYECPNCHFQGTMKVSTGNVKLNWRLDWPAKWTIFKTTCEPAGKDHCTPGGSYDTGLELCKRIYGYEGPIKVPYEWLRLGDTDMGTSKGIILTPHRFLEMAEPEIMRMLILQTNPNKAINFRTEELPQYYNEYDRLERIYFGLEETTDPAEEKETKYVFPLIASKEPPTHYTPKLSFKYLTGLAQLQSILGEDGIYQKAKEVMERENFDPILTPEEFQKKIQRAANWIDELKNMMAEETDPENLKKLRTKADIFTIPDHVTDEIREELDDLQKQSFQMFLEKLNDIDSLNDENIKEIMMDIQQQLGIKSQKIFTGFYLVLLGTKQGPRLGPLLSMLEKEWIIKRLNEAL